MRKQGPPATLEELGINLKRKPQESRPQNGPAKKKRRTSDDELEPPAPVSPTKLVKLDRVLRQERAGKDEKRQQRQKTKKEKLVNNDAQITIPPPIMEDDEDLEEDAEEVHLEDAALDDAASQEGLDEMILEQMAPELTGSDQSVFDSDPDVQAQKMFSEDEDDSDAEAKLTAANIEGLSRKLDQEQQDVDAEAQQELEDAAIQTNIAADTELLDTAQAGPGLAPDLQLIRSRMTRRSGFSRASHRLPTPANPAPHTPINCFKISAYTMVTMSSWPPSSLHYFRHPRLLPSSRPMRHHDLWFSAPTPSERIDEAWPRHSSIAASAFSQLASGQKLDFKSSRRLYHSERRQNIWQVITSSKQPPHSCQSWLSLLNLASEYSTWRPPLVGKPRTSLL